MHNKTCEIILLLYLLFSFSMPSALGLLKRSTELGGAVSTARWDVSLNQTGINNNISIAQNGTGTYTLKVVSNSEVDTKYSIVVNNIPSGVDVKLDNGSFITPVNNKVTFTNAGTIIYNAVSNENTHTLTFRATNGATPVNNQSVTVNVNFQQDL